MKQLRFLLFVTFVFLALVIPSKGFAEAIDTFPYIGEINEEQTELHREATTDSTVKLTLKKGDIIGIIGGFQNNLGEEWVNVSFNDTKGWAKKTSVFAKKELPGLMYINKEHVNVYKGASLDYSTATTVKYGQKVAAIDSFINKEGEVWYKVDTGNIQGWVHAEDLTSTPINVNKQEKQTKITQVQENKEQVIQEKPFLEKVVYIKKNNTKIHRGAVDSYRVVYTAKENESLKAVGEFTNNKNEKWLNVELPTGVRGWVIEASVQNEPLKESQVLPDYIFVKSNDAVARRGALTDYRVVSSFAKNESLKVIDSFTNNNKELWYQVQISSTLAGWVLSTDISKEPKVNTTYYLAQYGNVRTDSQNSADVILSLSKGSAIYVVNYLINDIDELWYQVKLEDGQLGWINGTFVTGDVVLLNQTLKAGTKNTYVYWGASDHYKKVATLKEGTSVKVLSEFINSNNEHWYNVELSNKTKGWVLKQELFSDLSTRTFVYSIGDDLLYKDTSEISESTTKVSTGDKLLVLTTSNQSLYVENTKGVRGWISEEKTTDIAPAIPNNSGALAGKKIVLDAGHGGKDSGAIGPTKLYEKDVVFAVAQKLKEALELEGATVALTRSSDVFIELNDRVKIADATNYDVFISIHANANTSKTANGTETYFHRNKKGTSSELLAKCIQEELVKSLNTRNRGTKTAGYAVLKSKLPTVLVELAFISNPEEEKMLRSDEGRNKATDGIIEGLKKYFNGGK